MSQRETHAAIWFFQTETKLFWRQKGPFLGSLLFALILVLLLCFSLEFQTLRSLFTPPALWIGLLFSISIMMEREWNRDRREGMMDRIRLFPTSMSAWYWGKILSSLLRLMVYAFWLTLCVKLFMGAEGSFALYFGSMVLAGIGIIALGVLLSAFSIYSEMPEILFPILFYPLLIPLVLTGSHLMTTTGGRTAWLKVLLGIDILYLGLGTLLFRTLEERET